ncbi:MAG TPA: methyltransferase domain-containing protein [Xanthobacteraceae bacterium]|jgi:SAM-dependent methyltransferase|nr:methyltransferase domain-containing protein [Xanthobacteraceae bacterium]
MRAYAKLFIKGFFRSLLKNHRHARGTSQALDIYMDESFAKLLEQWGNGTVWNEIQIFLADREGNVLDLACGTGRVYDFLRDNVSLDYYGCDISALLIEKAVKRGIDRERLCVGDATKLEYRDNQFDYLFSIGSLEHFTEEGIRTTLKECRRVCSGITFHMMPVSRSGFDEGWVTSVQSYWHNSERWWLQIFREVYGDSVWTMRSAWSDRTLFGNWFVTAHPMFFTRKKLGAIVVDRPKI